MPEPDTEALTFALALLLITLIASLAALAGAHVGPTDATQRTAPQTTEEPFTPDCPPTPNETVGRCVDSDGDGTPDYRCYDNVDCGDDQLTLTPTYENDG